MLERNSGSLDIVGGSSMALSAFRTKKTTQNEIFRKNLF